LRLLATGVGKVDADRYVRFCDGVIRSSDMSLPLSSSEPAPDPFGSPRNRLAYLRAYAVQRCLG